MRPIKKLKEQNKSKTQNDTCSERITNLTAVIFKSFITKLLGLTPKN